MRSCQQIIFGKAAPYIYIIYIYIYIQKNIYTQNVNQKISTF